MLDLPNVTLLFVETRAHAITKRVIDDCISKVNFGDILLYTDKPDLIRFDPNRRARTILVPDFPNKTEAGRFYYQHAVAGITTDFALMLEWDAGIYDTKRWKPEFLDYDYIGAPWIVRPEEWGNKDVGNGGFTIMSKRLGTFLHENATKYPVVTDWDLCRNYRQALEAAGGFKWPDRNLAAQFSWELGLRDPENFGFHGAFNWPHMLEREEVIERAKIMLTSPYLTGKMRDLIIRGKATWLEKELGEELWTKYLGYHPAISSRGRPKFSSQQRQNMGRLLAERQAAHMVLQSKGLKA